jgi:hypothetical protein
MTSALALFHELNNNGKRPNTTMVADATTPAYRPRSVGNLSAAALDSCTMTFDEACSIVQNPLRDELIKTYFLHVHPLCPIIDEFDWFEFYDDIEEIELKKHPNLLLFQVMMFAASAVCTISTYPTSHLANHLVQHITDNQLKMTTYKSVYETQKAQFEKITVSYDL